MNEKQTASLRQHKGLLSVRTPLSAINFPFDTPALADDMLSITEHFQRSAKMKRFLASLGMRTGLLLSTVLIFIQMPSSLLSQNGKDEVALTTARGKYTDELREKWFFHGKRFQTGEFRYRLYSREGAFRGDYTIIISLEENRLFTDLESKWVYRISYEIESDPKESIELYTDETDLLPIYFEHIYSYQDERKGKATTRYLYDVVATRVETAASQLDVVAPYYPFSVDVAEVIPLISLFAGSSEKEIVLLVNNSEANDVYALKVTRGGESEIRIGDRKYQALKINATNERRSISQAFYFDAPTLSKREGEATAGAETSEDEPKVRLLKMIDAKYIIEFVEESAEPAKERKGE